MTITPAHLFELAIERHRQPWNWTSQFTALGLFCLTLLLHSYLLLAATLIFFGAGFFRMQLPEPPNNRWFRFVTAAVEWEKDWIAAPWNWDKSWRFGLALIMTIAAIWAFWKQEPAAIALLICFAFLARVVFENKNAGIDP